MQYIFIMYAHDPNYIHIEPMKNRTAEEICEAFQRSNDIFTMRSIDRAAGCMVIVRPDQYVGHILPLTARTELAAYFAGILRVRG